MEKNLLADLKKILISYRWSFLKAFTMLLLSNCLLIVNPLIFRHAIIALSTPSPPSPYYWQDAVSHSIVAWGLLLVAVAGLSGFFKYKMRVGFIGISRIVETKMRFKLFKRIQAQSKSFYDHHGIGELLSRLTNDISSYRDVLGPGIMYPLFFLTIVTPGIIALFTISSKLAVLSLIPLVGIPLINGTVRNKIYALAKKVQSLLGTLSSLVQEYYSGIRIIKGYAVEEEMSHRFDDLSKRLSALTVRLVILEGLLFPLFTLLTKAVTLGLIFLSGYIIVTAWGELNAADFVSFMWIQSYIFFPVLMLAWVFPIYEKGRAAYDRLFAIYNEPIEVTNQLGVIQHVPPQADIVLNHLSFAYPMTSRLVLKDINLRFKGGSFVGITGPIGSGKTTLFRLLNREYEVPTGAIHIGNKDIHDYALENFNQSIITVEQAPFLFSRTIAENVKFGKQEASQEELELVARHADLHETVLEFPDRYDTLIGERGVTLSGGQKQRVAMARAFLMDRSILLLDDIFAAVDTLTESRIFSAMQKNFAGKTVLIITHRASILERLDRIIYMMDGQVVEDGSPAELVAKGGYFAALVELQKISGKSI